jgi:hypothetical protein
MRPSQRRRRALGAYLLFAFLLVVISAVSRAALNPPTPYVLAADGTTQPVQRRGRLWPARYPSGSECAIDRAGLRQQAAAHVSAVVECEPGVAGGRSRR